MGGKRRYRDLYTAPPFRGTKPPAEAMGTRLRGFSYCQAATRRHNHFTMRRRIRNPAVELGCRFYSVAGRRIEGTALHSRACMCCCCCFCFCCCCLLLQEQLQSCARGGEGGRWRTCVCVYVCVCVGVGVGVCVCVCVCVWVRPFLIRII